MELHIGEQIKSFRKRLNLTQEQLAAAVGVSTPAVSKWESESSYPDITLLIPIARALNTTVDELMDFQKSLPVEAIPAIGKTAVHIFESEGCLAGITFCQKQVNENPNCPLLKYHLAMLLSHYLLGMGEDEQPLAVQTAINWLECSAKISEPVEIKLASLHYLGQLYLFNGELEKAQQTFEKLPLDIGLDFACDLATIYNQQEKYQKVEEICQSQLYIDICYACSALINLSYAAEQQDEYQKSFDFLELQLKLLELFKINSERAVYAYTQMADVSLKMDNDEQAASCLTKMISKLENLDSSPINGNWIFNKVKDCTQVTSADFLKQATKNAVQKALENSSFRNSPCYKEILSRLSKI